MKERISIYCRLSNERDSVYHTEKKQGVKSDEPEQTDESKNTSTDGICTTPDVCE